jgi:zinc/manganese transport system permease protein
MLAATIASGFGIAVLGKRAAQRDVEIGSVLAFALGLGLLFLSLYRGYATEAYSILFGEILGISSGSVLITLAVSIAILAAAALSYRPILFASLDEDVAEAKGMKVVLLGVVFMVLLAASVSIAIQVSGVLLIFALMVTPAATAVRITKKPNYAIALSVAIALFATWSGLFIAFYEPYPVSFFITSIVFALYLLVRLIYR